MSDSILLLLVGSNPLPNYLAACALRPSWLALVHTKETEKAKDRLKNVLRNALGAGTQYVDPDTFVSDATCATTVQRAIGELLQRSESRNADAVLLNYTGGTKVMAVHARMAFKEAGHGPERASYIDEGGHGRQPQLRFDDGRSNALSEYPDVPLDLSKLLGLHGLTHSPRSAKAPAPTIADAAELLCKVLQDVPLAAALYCERERLEEWSNPTKAIDSPFRADIYGLTLSLPQFPTSEHLNSLTNRKERESWYEQWYRFIGGEWLEKWFGEQIRRLEMQPTPEIKVGFDAFRGAQRAQLEIDVAVVRGHRSYFISCTTDTTKAICKSKLFEVAVRSRHLGGDLARAALVCLADNKTAAALRTEIDDVWEASNTPCVFGLSDITAWSDCGGKQPNRHSLKTWLES